MSANEEQIKDTVHKVKDATDALLNLERAEKPGTGGSELIQLLRILAIELQSRLEE